jgi:hypothetical protein
MPPRVGRPALAIGAIALAGVIAMPALAQELSPSPSDEPSASASASPSGSEEATASTETSPSLTPSATSAPTSASTSVAPSVAVPAATGAPSPAATGDEDDENDEGSSAEAEKAEAPPITLTGVVGVQADGKHPHYTLTVGSLVYQLETGPWWFWGDAHPLAPFVGKAATIRGEAEGTNAIEVFSANGTTIREPGKPPWAGGPKVVGEKHPGWKPWMAGGKPGKGPKTPDGTTP